MKSGNKDEMKSGNKDEMKSDNKDEMKSDFGSMHKENSTGYLGEKHIYPDYPILRENARKNRNNMTDAEWALWSQIRNNRLGVRFRRQHIIGDYIVDFVCLEKHLIIEVDGGYHRTKEQQEEDNIRTHYLTRWGYRVLRFGNEEVTANTDNVTEQIKKELTTQQELTI